MKDKNGSALEQAIAMYEDGNLQAARTLVDTFLRQQPRNPQGLQLKARLAAGEGDLAGAAAFLAQALAVTPDDPMLHYDMGIVQRQRGDLATAAACYRKALALQPAFVAACYNLANILNEQGDTSAAAEHYERVVTLDPRHVRALGGLCHCYEALNQPDKARAAVEQTLRLDPGNPIARRVAATLLRIDKNPEEGYRILSQTTVPDDHRLAMGIHFELGKLCDTTQRYEEALFHFHEGNRHLRALAPTAEADRLAWLHTMDKLQQRFTRDWVDSWHEGGSGTVPAHCDPPLVFLVGFPRSGTTLLDQILDSHPQIQVIEEKPLLAELVQRLSTMGPGYPDTLATLSTQDIESLRGHYFARARQYVELRHGAWLVDKMPLNIVHAGLCARVFPEAKYLLALRHPCDTCLSCFMQPFAHNEAMASFYTLDDSAALYDLTMGLWRQYTMLFPFQVHAIKYEDLVEDFTAQVGRLLEFLDIPWDDSVADYARHATRRGHINTPSYNQVTQPIYRSARYRWLRYRPWLGAVEDRLRPWLAFFSYQDNRE